MITSVPRIFHWQNCSISSEVLVGWLWTCQRKKKLRRSNSPQGKHWGCSGLLWLSKFFRMSVITGCFFIKRISKRLTAESKSCRSLCEGSLVDVWFPPVPWLRWVMPPWRNSRKSLDYSRKQLAVVVFLKKWLSKPWILMINPTRT